MPLTLPKGDATHNKHACPVRDEEQQEQHIPAFSVLNHPLQEDSQHMLR
jgi:hypothetical protein